MLNIKSEWVSTPLLRAVTGSWYDAILALQLLAERLRVLGQKREADQVTAYAQTFVQHAGRHADQLVGQGEPQAANGESVLPPRVVGTIRLMECAPAQTAVVQRADDAETLVTEAPQELDAAARPHPGVRAAFRLRQVTDALAAGGLELQTAHDFHQAQKFLANALALMNDAERALAAAENVLMGGPIR